jgi:nucleotide-binding universal stress UspA family protein
MSPIVCFTDFSAVADQAMDAALQISERCQAEMYLVHATGSISDLSEIESEMNLLKKTRREGVGKNSFKRKTIAVEKIGDLNREVERLGAGMVIIGSRGRNRTRDVFFGSTTKRAILNIDKPVLIIKESTDFDQINNVVIASSFFRETQAPFSSIIPIIESCNLSITLLKVITPENFETFGQSQFAIRDFAKKVGLSDYDVHIRNHDKRELGIEEFMKDRANSILLVGTHEKGALSSVFYGSSADQLSKHIKQPVLSVLIKKTIQKSQ